MTEAVGVFQRVGSIHQFACF